MTNSKPVSLRPSDSVSDQPDLSIMSLEEVVSRYKDTEKRRSMSTEPENEQEVHWPIRQSPVELMSTLRLVSSKLNVSRGVLTKCMSRQLVDWYVNSLGLDKLRVEYEAIYSKIKARGYSTLRIQAENPPKFTYLVPTEVASTSLCSIRWVIAKLQDVRAVVGMSSTDLLLSGMLWSLTTLENQDWDGVSISRYFVPQVYETGVLVTDRLADVQALCTKYQYREDIGYNKEVYHEST